MGLNCMSNNCGGSYCLNLEDQYQRNILFKPINTKLIIVGEYYSPQEKQVLEKSETSLIKSEEERAKIAEIFQDLLDNTGLSIISHPTLERALITYIIYLYEQIIMSAMTKKLNYDKNDFATSNFITITKKKPYITFDEDVLYNLKVKYGIDLNLVNTVEKIRRIIIDFLSTVEDKKKVLEKQYEIIGRFLIDFGKNSRLTSKLKDSLEQIKYIINYFIELDRNLISVRDHLKNPNKIELFFNIAQNAAKRGIRDLKELVYVFSLGDNVGGIITLEETIVDNDNRTIKY